MFSRIPDFVSVNQPGRVFPSKLVGMSFFNRDLYVTTSTSGAYIYKILPNGKPLFWADIGSAVKQDTGRNVNCETAQHGGLRGVAFPPDFQKSGLFYTSFMEARPKNPPGFRYLSRPWPFGTPTVADSVVAEFRYDFTKKTVVKGSYRSVLRIGLRTKDHPIKQITFQGRFLLVAHGDGSLGSNPSPGGMNNDGLGKILRIDPRKLGTSAYRIPTSNPFVWNKKYKPEIYAIGFRNPHNICWSTKSGLYVADVGRDNVEEINLVARGGNYGWGKREGTFINLWRGGTLTGIAPLPEDDAKYGYIYPAVQLGHAQPEGGQIRWGIAIAGSCPVENGSPMSGTYMYANFGERGELYYSWIGDMLRATKRGPPKNLSQARVFRVRRIIFHSGSGKNKKKVVTDSLVGLVSADRGKSLRRVDARFGRGRRGEIYIMSKATGTVYIVMSTVPKWK